MLINYIIICTHLYTHHNKGHCDLEILHFTLLIGFILVFTYSGFLRLNIDKKLMKAQHNNIKNNNDKNNDNNSRNKCFI